MTRDRQSNHLITTEAANEFSTTTFSTSSSAQVTSTAGPNGADVVVNGEGNFNAQGVASGGGETVFKQESSGKLAETQQDDQPDNDTFNFVDQAFGDSQESDGSEDEFTTTTFSTSSSAQVTSTAGPNGADVVVNGEGNFNAQGVASGGGETVFKQESSGKLAETQQDDQPDNDQPDNDTLNFTQVRSSTTNEIIDNLNNGNSFRSIANKFLDFPEDNLISPELPSIPISTSSHFDAFCGVDCIF